MKILFSNPAPSFDDPMEMLVACHGRIRDQCATLLKLVRHLPEHGADVQARQAATNVVRYFDNAGPHHHEDEEQDLFPVLQKASASIGDHVCRELIEGLQREHRKMEQAWNQLRSKLALISNGDFVAISAEEAQRFVEGYADHIALEENLLLPRVARLLSSDQIRAIGKSMARRRGVKFDRLDRHLQG